MVLEDAPMAAAAVVRAVAVVRRRPRGVAAVRAIIGAFVAAALAGAIAVAGAPSADAAPGDMVLVFEATAGQKGYVTFGGTSWDSDAVETVDVRVDWGDGSPASTYTSVGSFTHTYAADGTYTVTISRRLAADGGSDTGPWLTIYGIGRDEGSIRLEDSTGTDLLTSTEFARLVRVESFGDLGVTSMNNAFNRHIHLTDVPATLPSTVADLSNLFRYAAAFDDADVGSWDVSNVTRMEQTFSNMDVFNRPLATWDVGAVTSMEAMFENALLFDQDLTDWDVSSVTTMVNMFEGAAAFNGDISTWKDRVGNVQDFSDFLKDATSFDQDLPDWDVSGSDDLDSFFEDATSFDGSLAGWTFSSTVGVDLSNFLEGATSFDQPLSSWVTTSIDDTNDMFYGATLFDQDLSTWDVSNVTNMDNMFRGAAAFDQDLSAWDVSSVLDMDDMFNGATAFDGDVSTWDVSSVEDMDDMFRDAVAFDQDLSAWDVSSATGLTDMFNGATAFDRSLGDWRLAAGANLSGMLDGSGMSTSCYDATLNGWAALDPPVTGRGLTADGLTYSTDGAAARAVLVDDRSWTISGDADGGTPGGICGAAVTTSVPASSGPTLSCTPAVALPGTTVTCAVTGGDPDVEILWRAGGASPFASQGVRIGPDGSGAFTFTFPADAVDGAVPVELVAWGASTQVAVGFPVPNSIPSGGGPAGRPALPAGLPVAVLLGAVLALRIRRAA